MKLLLDTHIWLWSLLEPSKLTRRVSRELTDAANQLWLSPISVWEALTLARKGRLTLSDEPASWIARALQAAPVAEAPISSEVALETARVRLPHNDPADRFLVATARVFDLTLVTADETLLRAKQVRMLTGR
jgi:PIN domain nuclease of toxin-antitoxin system